MKNSWAEEAQQGSKGPWKARGCKGPRTPQRRINGAREPTDMYGKKSPVSFFRPLEKESRQWTQRGPIVLNYYFVKMAQQETIAKL